MHTKSCLRSAASRSVVFTRPWGIRSLRSGSGMSTSTVISWRKPRYSSMLAAATLPAAMALMAEAGPVTQSPPA